MLSLDDEQMSILLAIAAPIPLQLRDAFLRALTDELRNRSDVGAGELHRLGIDVRKRLVPWTSSMVERIL
jgi:hypothetical protein